MMKMDCPDDAIEQWRKAIDLNPNLAQAYINIGRALSEKNAESIKTQ
jgi:tetratricopeptide (TPR) repeat protein